MTKTSGDTVIEVPLVENDISILLNAPLIIREVHRRHITASEFLDLLKQGLAQGLSPEGWLQELVNTGQFALARRLLRQSGGATAAELRRLSREWRGHCTEELNRVQRRLEAQRMILDPSVVSDLEEILVKARQLGDEWWFDLALEELAEIGRLLDLQIAEAIRERQEHFEMAQDLIMTVRREFMYSEPVVRQHGTTEIVWELLGYADRLSASSDYDLKQIEFLCDAIRQLYQGAPVDATLLNEIRSLYGWPGAQARTKPAVPIQEIQESALSTVPMPTSLTTLKLEREPLSSAARTLFDELAGDEPCILLVDLSQATMPSDVSWNEKAAREAQNRARSLWFTHDTYDLSRASKLLQITLYLLRYWGERRRSVPDEVRRDLAGNLFYYADGRASNLLKTGRWDAACEYYRIAIRLRARRGHLIGAERSVLNYFAAYATHKLSPDRYVDELREIRDLGADRMILASLQMGLEHGDENASVRIAQGLVKLAAEDPWLLETVQAALRGIQDDVLRGLLVPAFEQVGQLLDSIGKQQALDEKVELLVDGYHRFQQRLDDTLHRLLDATNSIRTLRALPDIVGELQTLSHQWEPTDQELLSSLGVVGDGLSRYFTAGLPFQERDRLANNLLQQDIPSITQFALSSPTKLGVLHLSRVADNIQLLLEEDYALLRRVSLPTLEAKVEQSEWRSDGFYYCHLCVENMGDMRAENVRIRVEESPIGDYQIIDKDQEQELGNIYSSQPRFLHIRVQPTPLEETQDAFALFARLQYQVPQQAGFEVRSPRLRVEGFAAQRSQFQPIRNPYVVGGPVKNPELFRGRQELIDALLLEVASPERSGSVVIFGQKRSGKTSLLYHLSLQTPDFVVPVFFDIPQVLASLPRVNGTLPESQREIIKEEMLGRFLLALIKRTVTQCQNRGLHILPMSWEELMEKPGPDFQFRQFLEQFRACEDGRRLLFLFDEFTALMAKIDEAVIDDMIMRLLKSLIEHGYFSCIICGLTEVYEAVKRYANQLAVSQPRMVDYLDYEAASGLIQDPIRMPGGRSRFYSQPVVDEIIDLTAGNPFYVQMFCHRLVEYMNEMEIERVTSADISQITKSLIEGSDRIDLVQFDNLYKYKDDPDVDDRAATLEGLVVHLLAHETSTKSYTPGSALHNHVQHFVTENELDQTLSRLEQRRSIIQQTDEPSKTRRSQQPLRARHYRIRVGLFRRWLLANRPVDEEALRSFERKLRR